MNDKFLKWVQENKQKLNELGLEVEIYIVDKEAKEQMADPAQRIYCDGKKYTGSICVWKSGQMDVQIVDIETEEQVLYEYLDKLPLNLDFSEVLKLYIKKWMSN